MSREKNSLFALRTGQNLDGGIPAPHATPEMGQAFHERLAVIGKAVADCPNPDPVEVAPIVVNPQLEEYGDALAA